MPLSILWQGQKNPLTTDPPEHIGDQQPLQVLQENVSLCLTGDHETVSQAYWDIAEITRHKMIKQTVKIIFLYCFCEFM